MLCQRLSSSTMGLAERPFFIAVSTGQRNPCQIPYGLAYSRDGHHCSGHVSLMPKSNCQSATRNRDKTEYVVAMLWYALRFIPMTSRSAVLSNKTSAKTGRTRSMIKGMIFIGPGCSQGRKATIIIGMISR